MAKQYVPRDREMVFTVFVNLGTLIARGGRIREARPGEVELPRWRKPEGHLGFVVATANRLNTIRAQGKSVA